jgi:membrane fusion protein, copper/silver efflux system
MKKFLLPAVVLISLTIAFLLGSSHGRKQSGPAEAAGGRKILYYVDPMNPSHTSDKPGLAPCGMKMEPVYADTASGPAPGSGPVLPGTVKVSLEKQQLIGVRLGVAEKKAVQQTIRLLGKVAADETRSFQVTAPSEGWITKAMPVTAGSFVRKDETLAMFYSPTFIGAGQALRNALEYQDRMQTNTAERIVQRPGLAEFNVKQYRDSLRNLGVSDRQIDDMIRTRQYTEQIDIVTPADGFITARNVSLGQRFEKGFELYRIVDLNRVWIVADVANREAPLVPPGVQARISVPAQNIMLEGKLSDALPQFDNVTRTLKLRFEADNPGVVLKPDMFVDVEFTVSLPESLVVPAEAVLDSGLRKTVFVDRGNGYFEPRTVQTGWRVGEYIQVLQGLMPGEPIVTSGNFLLDSESRMKLAASGVHGAPAMDPVCGMGVDEAKARASKRASEHAGKTYFFCNDGCKKEFDANPAQYLGGAKPPPAHLPAAQAASIDPVCGMQVTETKARAAKRFSEHQGKTYFFCNEMCKQQFDANPGKYLGGANAKPAAPPEAPPARATDPVCGMKVIEAKARAANRFSEYQGKTYFFCNNSCKQEFDAEPAKYLGAVKPK